MSTIEFNKVTRVFKRDNKDFLTIDGFDLTVNDQEFVAIVGPSGCGKTTCMRMVAGLEFPSTGTVSVRAKR
jgi:NitT/TauT family transport system ATP-binding protein